MGVGEIFQAQLMEQGEKRLRRSSKNQPQVCIGQNYPGKKKKKRTNRVYRKKKRLVKKKKKGSCGYGGQEVPQPAVYKLENQAELLMY